MEEAQGVTCNREALRRLPEVIAAPRAAWRHAAEWVLPDAVPILTRGKESRYDIQNVPHVREPAG